LDRDFGLGFFVDLVANFSDWRLVALALTGIK
jgi:hypothetical protein